MCITFLIMPLNNDLLLYELYPMLDIGTLLSMTSINHRFYKISHEDKIWKQCLETELLSCSSVSSVNMDQRAIKVSRVDASSNPSFFFDKSKREIFTFKRLCLEIMRSIALFNRSPSEWHSWWSANVEDSPFSICKFLQRQRPNLRTKNLVEFLCRNPNGNREFLPQFVSSLDFRGLEVDWALRAYFMLLGMPSTQAAINRLIETFSTIYCFQNPDVFAHKDTVYKLFFSLLLLETDFHSPFITTKMSCQNWIRNNCALDEGRDLSPVYLTQLYDSALRHPILPLHRRGFAGWLIERIPSLTGPLLDNAASPLVTMFIRKIETWWSDVPDDILTWTERSVWCSVANGELVLSLGPELEEMVLERCALCTTSSCLRTTNSDTPTTPTAESFWQRLVAATATVFDLRGDDLDERQFTIVIGYQVRTFVAQSKADRDLCVTTLNWNMTLDKLGRFCRYFRE